MYEIVSLELDQLPTTDWPFAETPTIRLPLGSGTGSTNDGVCAPAGAASPAARARPRTAGRSPQRGAAARGAIAMRPIIAG